MKGGLAVAAHTARALAGGERPFARLELVSVPDEEIRSEPIATQARLAGFDAVLCMECGRPGGAVVAARKGGRWLDVVTRGRSAHAGSEPEHGRNAVLALARELPRIAALDGAREGLTLHVTRMQGGDVLNSIPGEARATIDMRGWHEADLDWAEEQLLRVDPHRGVTFTTEERLATPPLERTPPSRRWRRRPQFSVKRSARRCRRPPPGASRTAAGPPARACRPWTASGPSARSTTRRTSTSRSPRSPSAAASSRASWRRSIDPHLGLDEAAPLRCRGRSDVPVPLASSARVVVRPLSVARSPATLARRLW